MAIDRWTESAGGPGAHEHKTGDYQKRGTVDPSTASGVVAPIGALYSRDNAGAGEVWLKTGAANTAWTRIVVP